MCTSGYNEKYKLRVTLTDYESGKVLDSDSINMPYPGAGWYCMKGGMDDKMVYHARKLAGGLVGAYLKYSGRGE